MRRPPTIMLDDPGHMVWLDGRPVHLSSTLYRLFATLMAHPAQVITRQELLAELGETITEQGLITRMNRLRQALGPHAWLIQTVRGAGYRMRGGAAIGAPAEIARLQATLWRVQQVVAADSYTGLTPWERGYLNCAAKVRAALQTVQQEQEPA